MALSFIGRSISESNSPINRDINDGTSGVGQVGGSFQSNTASSTKTITATATVLGTVSSNGQIYTRTLTTEMITGAPTSSGTNLNIGVIVGGAVGGIGGLIIISLVVVFCLRIRRKHSFDGNFDPANVGYVKDGGGGTLPITGLEENGLLMGSNEAEDDGTRGSSGTGHGGIIMPYYPGSHFQPAPVGGTAVGQNHPQMQPISNIGVAADGVGAALAAGYPNRNRVPMGQQNAQPHTSNQSISSGSFYPSSSSPNPHLYSNSVSSEPYTPGPFVLSPSSGGRNAEAMGGVISNPQLPAFQQANLQTASGPGPRQQQQYLSSSSPRAVPSQLPTLSRADTDFVVHEDGGRVVFGEQEGEGEVLNSELPPTYDSLPAEVRRGG